MKHCLVLWLRLLLVFSVAPLAAQTVPPAFNYQGRLTDDQGQPLASGEYMLAFRLWSDATSASTAEPNHLVWGRERVVTVVNGAFNVILDDSGTPVSGAVSAEIGAAFAGANRFLGLTITRTLAGTVPVAQRKEILPRQQILSAPYALQAEQAAKATLAADLDQEVRDALTPPGTVIAWMGTNNVPPAGWEFCWGQEVSRTEPKFARLFAVVGTSNGAGDGSTTFHLPDLRGMFLRGVNGTRSGISSDPDFASRSSTQPGGATGNAVGSIQSDEFKRHRHGLGGSKAQFLGGGPLIYLLGNLNNEGDIGFEGGTETRPKNVYVHYLIKL
jgi:hypothetical protein